MEKDRVAYDMNDSEMSLLQKYMDSASDICHQKVKKRDGLAIQWECAVDESEFRCSEIDMPSVAPFMNEVSVSFFSLFFFFLGWGGLLAGYFLVYGFYIEK